MWVSRSPQLGRAHASAHRCRAKALLPYGLFLILIHMKQLIVELDDATARALERVAPARRRMRSEFIREAIRRALDRLEADRMEAAYRKTPQDPDDDYFDPAEWGDAAPPPPSAPARRRARRSRT
jgi:Arc/MetJ-type ribon-helix-helix transcriptional regulator